MKDSNENHNHEIHEAAKAGNLSVLKEILGENPAEVQADGGLGLKPLHFAAESGSLECVRFLIESGANVNSKCPKNQSTALFYASTGEIADYLINKGAELDIVSSCGRVPLDYAIQGLNHSTVSCLIQNGVDVNYRKKTDCYYTMLQWAVDAARGPEDRECRAIEILRLLLDAGADPNQMNSFDSTAIHNACRQGQIEMVRLLLEYGADPNIRDASLHDAFNEASDYPEILALLAPHRQEVPIPVNPKQTPVQLFDRLLSIGIVDETDLLPCSDEEIESIETNHSVQLPASYKVFLKRMGRGAGEFLTSDHWSVFYDDLESMGRRFDPNELDPCVLLPDAFIFASRLASIYFYFITDGDSDDPPVYGYGDDGDLGKVYESFWGFFEEILEYYEFYCDPKRFSQVRDV